MWPCLRPIRRFMFLMCLIISTIWNYGASSVWLAYSLMSLGWVARYMMPRCFLCLDFSCDFDPCVYCVTSVLFFGLARLGNNTAFLRRSWLNTVFEISLSSFIILGFTLGLVDCPV